MDFFNTKFKRLISVLAWPELKVLWLLLPLLAVVFVVSFSALPSFVRTIQGGLLIAIGITVFVGLYKAAKTKRENVIERNELRSVLFGLRDALIVYDKDFRALFFNPAAEGLFKLGADVVLDHEFKPQDVEKPAWRLLTQVIFPSLAPTIVSRSKAGEYPQIVDLSFTNPVLELQVVTSPINDEKGALLGFMKIIRNRTREISMIRSKNEFLSVASHQLRTPVTDINWALQSLSKEQGLNAASKTIVEGALKAGRDLLKIVEDLLNIAKIEEGRFGYNFEPIDILDFINEALSHVVPVARRAGVKLYFDRPKEQLPRLHIDQERLSLALNNLLENAVRYNVENGEIIVKAEKLTGQPFLEVSIKDTGIGIPQEGMSGLFQKFFRAENALKSQAEGSGLGLYIAKNIVQAHGGKIWAESEEGRGSTFHFTLPTDPSLVPRHEVEME